MPLTPQEVHSKVFGPTRFRRGYDEAEVDAFLDEVEVELTRLHGEIDALRGQLGADGAAAFSAGDPRSTSGPTADGDAPAVTSLSKGDAGSGDVGAGDAGTGGRARPDDSGDLEQRVARTLVLAQRAADEALHDAETQAEQMRLAAQAEVERMRAEAEEAAARERSMLERERSTAQDDVEQLRAFEREYRTRLRAYLELQLRELDGSGSAQVESRPAPALGAEAGDRAPVAGLPHGEQIPVGSGVADGPDGAGAVTSSVGATAPGFGEASHAAAESAPEGVSGQAVGEEQGHEPPRDGV